MGVVSHTRVKILVVTHGTAAAGMIQAVGQLVHDPALAGDFGALELPIGEPKDLVSAKIAEAVSRLDDGKGVIVAVDLHGSTPFNAAIELQHATPGRLCVVSGVNLPMLLKLASVDRERAIDDLAQGCYDTALRSIKVVPPEVDR